MNLDSIEQTARAQTNPHALVCVSTGDMLALIAVARTADAWMADKDPAGNNYEALRAALSNLGKLG